jgi:hypothetical protein
VAAKAVAAAAVAAEAAAATTVAAQALVAITKRVLRKPYQANCVEHRVDLHGYNVECTDMQWSACYQFTVF